MSLVHHWLSTEGVRDWLEAELDRRAAKVSPGAVVLHRLNRTEYAHAIRDLLDLEIDVTTLLPPDDIARGFDNIAGSLTLSPTLLESYSTAAARVARMAVGYWKTPVEATYLAPGDTSQNHHIEGLPLGTRGGMMTRHDFPADGEYKFAIQNFGIGSFIPGEQLELIVDGERAHLFKYQGVGLSQGMAGDQGDGILEVTVPIKAGSRTVGATFLATNFRPSLDMIKQYDRKSLENNSIPQLQYYPAIGFLRISGPFNAQRPEDSKSRRKVFACRPTTAALEETCARQILSGVARRAYRRPVTQAEVGTLIDFYKQGRADGTFDEGIELALRRLLASPNFLVRAEKEPASVAPGQPYRITDLDLASRLSFFLWSSIPDDELMTVARQGRLSTPRVLEQQVRRMLADPKSSALVTNFGQQLLYLRNLPATSPDGVFYPDWDDELRKAFQRETELFFESLLREDRNVVDLLTADYTFVNERLARHYGIPNIYGSHFRRVSLGPSLDYRRGILGKGSFLSVTWTQNFRSSPVKRGVWVLENILGTPPPEPPPNVPALEDASAGSKKVLTLREQMTLHRATPTCAGCHKIMDPIGFALDNFDADGKWRVEAGRRRRHADRRGRRTLRRAEGQRAGRTASGADALFAAVRGDDGREDDDLRSGPRRGIHRHADDPLDRARRGEGQQPLLGDRPRGREEPAVPDARQGARARDHHELRSDECFSPRSTFRGGPSCRAWASPWRCRCSIRWCPRSRHCG